MSVVLQCKLYARPVGNKAVQEVAAARTFYDAGFAAVVSNADYTEAARRLARRNETSCSTSTTCTISTTGSATRPSGDRSCQRLRRPFDHDDSHGNAGPAYTVRGAHRRLGDRHRPRGPRPGDLERQAVLRRARRPSAASRTARSRPSTPACPACCRSSTRYCVEQAVRTGLGLDGRRSTGSRCSTARTTSTPTCRTATRSASTSTRSSARARSTLDLPDGGSRKIGITRLHLEQDAGKSLHDQHPTTRPMSTSTAPASALMEIVSEPDIRTPGGGRGLPAQAALDPALSRHLRRQHGGGLAALRRQRLGAPRRRTTFGTRCEIKNVNSVRFVMQAIEYEARRQVELIEDGGAIEQETRLFDAGKGETRPMRSQGTRARLPLLPRPRPAAAGARPGLGRAPAREPAGAARRQEGALCRATTGSGLRRRRAGRRARDRPTISRRSAEGPRPQAGGQLGHQRPVRPPEPRPARTSSRVPVAPASLGGLIDLIADGTISGRIAKDVFADMVETGGDPDAIVEEQGLRQVTDTGAIEADRWTG